MYLQSIPVPSQRLKISADDTSPDFLASKLLAGTGVSLTVGNDGANETLTVANADTGSVAVSSHLSAFSHAPLLQAASAVANGYLSSTNWSTFNGKLTLPALTSGSVLFSDGTTIAQDNANLFWDATNKRVGINLTNPTRRIEVLDTSAPQIRLTHTAGSVYTDLQTTSIGYLEVNATGNRILLGKDDSDKTFWGAGYDMSLYYNGTDGYLKTDEVAASDLHLTTGAAKTLVYDTAVYDDFLPAITVFATGTNSPDIVNHTIQGVVGSYWGFDGGATEERLTIKIELLHGYKQGSDIEIHVHTLPSTTGSGDVEWFFDYYYSPINAAPIAGGTLSGVSTIAANTQYYDYTKSLGTISGTGRVIGDFIIGTLRRTPNGAGDTYGADMLLKQVAAHAEMDTLGSRQRYVK